MNESERLALELDRALNGGAWHGPSWTEALAGVDRHAAARRAIPGAHTIAEIVGHTALWFDVVRLRLGGEAPQVADSEDWRESVPASEEAWSAAVADALAKGRALIDTVRRFPADQLHQSRPRVDSTWYELVSGELQHLLYHAGQVALLTKAPAEPRTGGGRSAATAGVGEA